MNQYEEDIEQSVEQARYASKKKKKETTRKQTQTTRNITEPPQKASNGIRQTLN